MAAEPVLALPMKMGCATWKARLFERDSLSASRLPRGLQMGVRS